MDRLKESANFVLKLKNISRRDAETQWKRNNISYGGAKNKEFNDHCKNRQPGSMLTILQLWLIWNEWGGMKLSRFAILSCAFILVVLSSIGAAEDIPIAPAGEYADIDTQLSNDVIQILGNGSKKEKKKVIEKIEKNPENYAPPVFYALSNVLFDNGERDKGAFWFYVGQLRARFDANRCADSQARSAVSVLSRRYGAAINQYMFQDVPKLEKLVPDVVEWDRKIPHNYDHRWINLHGMSAIMEGLMAQSDKLLESTMKTTGVDVEISAPKGERNPEPKIFSLPKEEWETIAEQTRVTYLDEFRAAMAGIKKKN